MSKEEHASQPALGMPRPTRIALVVLASVSTSLLVLILQKLGRG